MYILSRAEGISGFTRALILRLVLSPERVWVSLRWAEGGAGAAGAHPAAHAHAVLPLPLARSVRDVLADHRPPGAYIYYLLPTTYYILLHCHPAFRSIAVLSSLLTVCIAPQYP